FLHALQPGLAFGRQPLDADNLETEGAAEITEGVVRGDKDARALRNAGGGLAGIVRKIGDGRDIGVRAALVVRPALRIARDQLIPDDADRLAPKAGVHPDMRIVAATERRRRDQAV